MGSQSRRRWIAREKLVITEADDRFPFFQVRLGEVRGDGSESQSGLLPRYPDRH